MLVRHHGGTQHAVIILGAVVFASTLLAAVNVLGDMELRAVQGDKDTTIETQERFKSLMSRQLMRWAPVPYMFNGHVVRWNPSLRLGNSFFVDINQIRIYAEMENFVIYVRSEVDV